MNPVQYIILNRAAKMSTGKAAAQAAHASQMGLLAMVDFDTRRNPYEKSIVNRWMQGGHYAKVVLEVADEAAMMNAEKYIAARDFPVACIIDEGRTEIAPFTRTALGTGVVDKDAGHVRSTFGAFKLYNDQPPPRPESETSTNLDTLTWWERRLYKFKEKGDAR